MKTRVLENIQKQVSDCIENMLINSKNVINLIKQNRHSFTWVSISI